jgi:curved DNA-binding protein
VAPWEAALGASISVPTPSGPVEVTVPPGSQSGRKLRLKGRGIPASQPGDLYLILDVVLPPASSERARELYQAMARDLAFNPRERIGA